MCVLIVIFMLNHFPYEIMMYYNYFSKGHNVGKTFVHPFSALWQTLTLQHMKKNLRTEQSVPIDTMLKAHIIVMINSLQSDSRDKHCLLIMKTYMVDPE